MTDEIPTMTCDWCGKVFPADARACCEGGWSAYQEPIEGEEWKGEQQAALPDVEFTAAQRQAMKDHMGLTDPELDELLATGKVEGLGTIVCLECQDAAAAEAEGNP